MTDQFRSTFASLVRERKWASICALFDSAPPDFQQEAFEFDLDNNGMTLLYYAAATGGTRLVKKLIELGCDFKSPIQKSGPHQGKTPIDLARLHHQDDIVKLLETLEATSEVQIETPGESSPLQSGSAASVAAAQPQQATHSHNIALVPKEMLQLLLKTKNIERLCPWINTVPEIAVLLKRTPSLRDQLFILAATHANETLGKELVNKLHGLLRVDCQTPIGSGPCEGMTLLFVAATTGRTKIVSTVLYLKYHVKQGTVRSTDRCHDPMRQGSAKGITSLCIAVAIGQQETVELMIKIGVRFKKAMTDGPYSGMTPLDVAIALNQNGSHDGIIALLGARGAKPTASVTQLLERRSSIHLCIAVAIGHKGTVELMIKRGVWFEEAMPEGEGPYSEKTPLDVAIALNQNGSHDGIIALLGAPVAKPTVSVAQRLERMSSTHARIGTFQPNPALPFPLQSGSVASASGVADNPDDRQVMRERGSDITLSSPASPTSKLSRSKRTVSSARLNTRLTDNAVTQPVLKRARTGATAALHFQFGQQLREELDQLNQHINLLVPLYVQRVQQYNDLDVSEPELQNHRSFLLRNLFAAKSRLMVLQRQRHEVLLSLASGNLTAHELAFFQGELTTSATQMLPPSPIQRQHPPPASPANPPEVASPIANQGLFNTRGNNTGDALVTVDQITNRETESEGDDSLPDFDVDSLNLPDSFYDDCGDGLELFGFFPRDDLTDLTATSGSDGASTVHDSSPDTSDRTESNLSTPLLFNSP